MNDSSTVFLSQSYLLPSVLPALLRSVRLQAHHSANTEINSALISMSSWTSHDHDVMHSEAGLDTGCPPCWPNIMCMDKFKQNQNHCYSGTTPNVAGKSDQGCTPQHLLCRVACAPLQRILYATDVNIICFRTPCSHRNRMHMLGHASVLQGVHDRSRTRGCMEMIPFSFNTKQPLGRGASALF